MKGDSCKVYSSSQEKWLKGKITKQLEKEGWVTVEYGDGLEKDLNINDKEHIKLRPAKGARPKTKTPTTKASDSSSKIKVGTQCEVFSRSKNKWIKAEVVKQLDASHVRVKYQGGGEGNIKIDDKNFRLSTSERPAKSERSAKSTKSKSSGKVSVEYEGGLKKDIDIGDDNALLASSGKRQRAEFPPLSTEEICRRIAILPYLERLARGSR